MIVACICGGVIETFLVITGLGALFACLKRLCKKRGCECECHEEKKPKCNITTHDIEQDLL